MKRNKIRIDTRNDEQRSDPKNKVHRHRNQYSVNSINTKEKKEIKSREQQITSSMM